MFIFVSLVHVVMCLILIIIVLLQSGKGSDLASAFGGGGSQTMFGSHGAASFLNKLTTVAAIMFMVTSLTLAILSAVPEKSMMEDVDVPAQTTETAPLPQPGDTGEQTDMGTAPLTSPDGATVPETAPADMSSAPEKQEVPAETTTTEQ